MGDLYSDPRHLEDYDRAVLRELDQREWEADDTRVIPHPRPRRPHRASRSEWAATKRVFAGRPCQVCGRESTDLHHILSRDGDGTWPRGDDYRQNLAALCRRCHDLITKRDLNMRALLRENMTWQQLDYLRRRIGANVDAFLERHYPERTAA